MTPKQLEQYLREHIPLVNAMEISVVKANDHEVIFSAPLAPNINQHHTVFGGSASAVAIIAAWSLLYVRLENAGLPSSIVIQRNTMEYLHPIAGPFTARAFMERSEEWESFMRMFTRKGRGRATVTCALEYDGVTVGRLTGEFVAFAGEHG